MGTLACSRFLALGKCSTQEAHQSQRTESCKIHHKQQLHTAGPFSGSPGASERIGPEERKTGEIGVLWAYRVPAREPPGRDARSPKAFIRRGLTQRPAGLLRRAVFR